MLPMLLRAWCLAAVASADLFRVPFKRFANKTWELELNASFAVGADESGNTFGLGVDDWKNIVYYGAIELGTPPQTETVTLDTGSGVLWVPSASQFQAVDHNIYKPGASSSYQSLHKNATLRYGIGQVFVEFGLETVQVGSIIFQKFPFGRVTSGEISVIPDYPNAPIDGLMGLAIQSSVVSYFLSRKGLLSAPVFGFYIGTESHAGELVFGGVDPDHVAGSFTYAPLISSARWMVSLDGVSVGGHSVGHAKGAVVDSGTTLVAGPPVTIGGIAGTLAAATGCSWTFLRDAVLALKSCKGVALPDVAFTIGGVNFTLQEKDYSRGYNSEFNVTVLEFMVLGSAAIDFLLLGDTFMRKYYVEFDFGQKRLGFAPAAVPSSGGAVVVV